MKNAKNALVSLFCRTCALIASSSFWIMAFIAYLLRIFVVPPFGALLAITVSIIWCIGNVENIRAFIGSVRQRMFHNNG
jgi:hypothetical protein